MFNSFETLWTVAWKIPSVHGISQARILEWVAISFSRGSFQPRDWTHLSCIGWWVLYCWVTKEACRVIDDQGKKKKIQGLERLDIDLEGSKTGCQVSLLHVDVISHRSLPRAQVWVLRLGEPSDPWHCTSPFCTFRPGCRAYSQIQPPAIAMCWRPSGGL